MAAGDAHRTWFAELVELLRARWRSSLTWGEWIALGRDLDRLLQEIRTERQILPPMITCRCCQVRARARPPRVSVRAAILALGRFGLAPEAEVKALNKAWAKHRKANGLDLYGQPGSDAPEELHGHAPGPSQAS